MSTSPSNNQQVDDRIKPGADYERPSRNTGEKKEILIKDWVYYLLLLNHYGIEDVLFALFMITLPSLTPLLQEPQYFNIEKEDAQKFNLLFLTTYNVGSMIGGVSNSFISRYTRISWTRLVLRFVILTSLVTSLVLDVRVLYASRVVLGFCCGVLQPNNMSEAYKLSPNKYKHIVGNFITMYVTLGIVIGMLMTYLAHSGAITWPVIFYVIMGIEVAAILVNVFYQKVDLSYTERLEAKDEKTARSILDRFLHKDTVDIMVRNENDLIELRTVHNNVQPFRTHWREFLVALSVCFVMVVSFCTSYSPYIVTLTCKDIRSVEEASEAAYYSTIASIVEVFPKLIQLIYPWLLSRRKLNFFAGITSVSCLWLIMALLYYYEQWFANKVMIIVWFFFLGMIIYPPYFSILTDLLTEELLGAIFAIGKIMEISYQALFAYVMKKAEDDKSIYWKVAITLSLFCAVAATTFGLFFFETNGMTKVQIYNRLAKNKPQRASEKKWMVHDKLVQDENNFETQ